MAGWLCRRTALHLASQDGHTETATALVKAGADVRCKDNDGYGFSGQHPCIVGLPQCGADGPAELHQWLFGLCRNTALHLASLNGHKETATALAKAGADVHCKNTMGYGSRAASLCRRFVTQRGG